MTATGVRRLLVLAGVVLSVVAGSAGAANAHPLGNFTTNTYAGIVLGADQVEVDYVLDLAEIPAFQVIERLGRSPRGDVDAAAARDYRAEQCAELSRGLDVHLDGDPINLRVATTGLSFPAGQAGLQTLRLECRLVADAVDVEGESTLRLVDGNFPNRLGWREITAAGDGTTVADSDVPADSLSARLTDYPEDLLQSPVDRRRASVTVHPGGGELAQESPADPGESLIGGLTRLTATFTGLVAEQDLTVLFALFAAATAVVLGALHALAPGHGKTVMAAYLVGSRGTSRQALQLGLTVACTHTAGVFALGLVLSASQSVAPERLYPYLGGASGLLFALLGLALLRRALAARRHGRSSHDHGHDHGHAHDHGRPLTWRSLLAPGLAGGLVPSPSALVVLLGGIAIGRAWFGATLVVGYGLGMAATLVGAGYLLVRVRDRLSSSPSRRLAGMWAILPVVTAGMLVAGGALIALRSLAAV